MYKVKITVKSGSYWAQPVGSATVTWRSPERGCTFQELYAFLCDLGFHPRDVVEAIRDAEVGAPIWLSSDKE